MRVNVMHHVPKKLGNGEIGGTDGVIEAGEVDPVPWKGIVFGVGSSSGRQGGYKDRLQGDEDLTERGLFHQFLQHFEVYTHAEGAAVSIHLYS